VLEKRTHKIALSPHLRGSAISLKKRRVKDIFGGTNRKKIPPINRTKIDMVSGLTDKDGGLQNILQLKKGGGGGVLLEIRISLIKCR